MTPQEQYTIKEMLEKMEKRSEGEHAHINKTLDKIGQSIELARQESVKADSVQDIRIGKLENFSFFAKGAAWLLTGSGALTLVYFLIKQIF
jgi:hypothetical protein